MMTADARPNILVVDDIAMNLQVMRRMLQSIHADISEASTGPQALSLLRERDFALVLLDVQMPAMSGFDVLEAMQTIERARHVPVIFITANYTADTEAVRGYQAGCVDYVLKPVNRTILCNKIKVFLQIYEQQRELTRMNIELQHALAEAREANEAKGRFLANVSHEMRTPLNGLIGMADLLFHTELTSKQHSFVDTIYRSSEILLMLINDLLDLSKLEADQIHLRSEPTDVYMLVKDVVRLLSTKAANNNVEFSVRCDQDLGWILVDPTRLQQVLMNLADNAIKFSQNSFVEILVEQREVAGDALQLRFAVEDGGIGIPEDRQSLIFQRFMQADSSTARHYGGTGLGLTICQKLVALMGGQLTVFSRVGEGSIFSFTLQCPLLRDRPTRPIKPPPPMFEGRRILVADNFAVHCTLLGTFFEPWQMECVTVNSGRDALDELDEAADVGRPYDMVIVDHDMPDMGGEALVACIRESGRWPNMKVVLMALPQSLKTSQSPGTMGFDAFLFKPIYQAELLDTLEEVFSGQPPTDMPTIHERTPATPILPRHDATILVVDDSEFTQIFLGEILLTNGYRTQVARTGKHGVEMIEHSRYDLVFMDCMMPEMDGYAAARKIRQYERQTKRPPVPIVAMTARAVDGDIDKCMQSGMTDYIAKPARRKDVERVIKKYVVAKSREDQNV